MGSQRAKDRDSKGTLRLEWIQPSKLRAWRKNPRRSQEAVNAIRRSIAAFGFNAPIVCDAEYRILAGHARCKAAQALAFEAVPVIVTAISGSNAKAFALADNQTATIAEWDGERLSAILHELKQDAIDLNNLGFSLNQLDALMSAEVEFPWDKFDTELEKQTDGHYALFRLRIPRHLLELAKMTVAARAKESGFSDKDHAIRSGKVFLKALGIDVDEQGS